SDGVRSGSASKTSLIKLNTDCPRRLPGRPPAGAFQCHRAPSRGVDRAATGRGVRVGGGPTESDPGPRPDLWRAIFASGQDVGHPGSGHYATLALAKCLCRARDRIDSPRMPGPPCGDRRTAPDGDPVGVRPTTTTGAGPTYRWPRTRPSRA